MNCDGCGHQGTLKRCEECAGSLCERCLVGCEGGAHVMRTRRVVGLWSGGTLLRRQMDMRRVWRVTVCEGAWAFQAACEFAEAHVVRTGDIDLVWHYAQPGETSAVDQHMHICNLSEAIEILQDLEKTATAYFASYGIDWPE